jgi:hypothetical protein
MMADRGLTYAVAALGASVLLAGGAVAEPSWQNYAQRCQPRELAGPAMRDPCEAPPAVFGLAGPQVLSRNQAIDVETTGSIGDATWRDREAERSPM